MSCNTRNDFLHWGATLGGVRAKLLFFALGLRSLDDVSDLRACLLCLFVL